MNRIIRFSRVPTALRIAMVGFWISAVFGLVGWFEFHSIEVVLYLVIPPILNFTVVGLIVAAYRGKES